MMDDREVGKRGLKREKIGKVLCDREMKGIVGLKGMLVCFRDGVWEFVVEFCVDGEEGKGRDKGEGLWKKEREGG